MNILQEIELNYEYIPAFQPIYDDDKPYYFMWGGRGGGKSYFMGDYLIDKSYTEKGVYLNTREKQVTIAASNYALLKGRIEESNRPYFYITNNNIKNKVTGTEFIFFGLSNITKENIKSMFDIKRSWCEESQMLTKESLEMLYPTVRENEGHLYFTFNRTAEQDPVYSFFEQFDCKSEKLRTKIDGKYYYWYLHYSKDAIGININYDGNPFFSQKLESDRLRDLKRLPDFEYKHIWEGAPRYITESTILHNIVIHDFDYIDGKVLHTGADWGFNDPNAIMQCFIADNELYVYREWYQNGLDPEELRDRLLDVDWIRGRDIFADSSRPEIIKLLNATHKLRVHPVKKSIGSQKDGKRYKWACALYLKQFNKIHIHTSCINAAKEFKKWSWETTKEGKILEHPADGDDHSVDSIIYALENNAFRWYSTHMRNTNAN